MSNQECKHEWKAITSEKDYAISIEQAEQLDVDHIEESTILGYICKKCKFTLSPAGFKEYNSFEKNKFDIKHAKLASIISIIAIIISIASFVVAISK